MNVLVIDNYDSFTYNLVQYLGELGATVDVVRTDRATVDELLGRGADRLVTGRPNPLVVGRDHSLVAAPELPEELELSASCEGIVMAVRHRRLPAEGVQFHPESVLTPDGKEMLGNFLAAVAD